MVRVVVGRKPRCAHAARAWTARSHVLLLAYHVHLEPSLLLPPGSHASRLLLRVHLRFIHIPNARQTYCKAPPRDHPNGAFESPRTAHDSSTTCQFLRIRPAPAHRHVYELLGSELWIRDAPRFCAKDGRGMLGRSGMRRRVQWADEA